MEQGKITPVEGFENLIKNFQYSDALWMLITILLVFLIYGLSLIKIRRETTDWRDVAFWGITILGWFFAFAIFGFPEIRKSQFLGYILLTSSFILSIISITIFAQSHKDTQKIVSSIIVGILGFGMSFTALISEMTLTYSLVFGFLLGLVLGRIRHAIKNLKLGKISKNKTKDNGDWDYTGSKRL